MPGRGLLGDKLAPVRSQEDLAERLADRGARVTQATLSRDLEELGAVRLRARTAPWCMRCPASPGRRCGRSARCARPSRQRPPTRRRG